jgi:hypothetical protein
MSTWCNAVVVVLLATDRSCTTFTTSPPHSRVKNFLAPRASSSLYLFRPHRLLRRCLSCAEVLHWLHPFVADTLCPPRTSSLSGLVKGLVCVFCTRACLPVFSVCSAHSRHRWRRFQVRNRSSLPKPTPCFHCLIAVSKRPGKNERAALRAGTREPYT